MSKILKICFAGLLNEKNLGDIVIIETAMRVYKDRLRLFHVDSCCVAEKLNLQASLEEKTYLSRAFCKIERRIYRYIRQGRFVQFHKFFLYVISHAFDYQLKGCHVAIVAGGGLVHYKYLDCGIRLAAFILACKRKRIQVIINSVGIEGFDKNNSICRLLRYAMNSSAVKMISTRDDGDTLRNKYLIGNNAFRGVVPCVAIFSRLLSKYRQGKNKIGIGLMRPGPFADFGAATFREKMVKFYVDIANLLSGREMPYEFFTNGLVDDIKLVQEIESQLGHEIKVVQPKTAEELVETIDGYRAIISFRMHSLIIAYSCGVLAYGIAWHSKVKKWFGLVEQLDFCCDITEMNADTATEMILNNIDDNEFYFRRRSDMEASVLDYIDAAIKNCILDNVVDEEVN